MKRISKFMAIALIAAILSSCFLVGCSKGGSGETDEKYDITSKLCQTQARSGFLRQI